MDKIILKNECAEFTAAICGAKPLSLIADGREWLAGYISPILFPVVGRVLNDEHIYNGKTYNMPLHGFAQKMDFIVEELTDTSVSLVLEANDETRAMYPFEFRLKVKAGLTGYAQVTGVYDTTPYDKLKMDMMYIENYSFRLDLQIILMTIKTMLFPPKSNAHDSSGILTENKDHTNDA